MKDIDNKLLSAVYSGDTEEVMSKLNLGGNPDLCNELGVPILHHAVRSGLIDMTQVLLYTNASVDATDTYGSTALHKAVNRGDTEAIELLLEYKANINHANNEGYTPLLDAVVENDLDTTALLIQKGADISIKMKVDDYLGFYGMNALHIAKFKENTEMIELLVANGAAPESKAQEISEVASITQPSKPSSSSAIVSSVDPSVAHSRDTLVALSASFSAMPTSDSIPATRSTNGNSHNARPLLPIHNSRPPAIVILSAANPRYPAYDNFLASSYYPSPPAGEDVRVLMPIEYSKSYKHMVTAPKYQQSTRI